MPSERVLLALPYPREIRFVSAHECDLGGSKFDEAGCSGWTKSKANLLERAAIDGNADAPRIGFAALESVMRTTAGLFGKSARR